MMQNPDSDTNISGKSEPDTLLMLQKNLARRRLIHIGHVQIIQRRFELNRQMSDNGKSIFGEYSCQLI
jgi:hypothetical protein